MERQKIFTLKDEEGLSLLSNILDSIVERQIPLHPSIIMSTFFLQMENIKNGFPLYEYALKYGEKEFNQITLAFKHHLDFKRHIDLRIKKLGDRLMNFIRHGSGKYLCRNHKEVTLLNGIHEMIMEEHTKCIINQLVYGQINISQFMLLSEFKRHLCWSAKFNEDAQYITPTVKTVEVTSFEPCDTNININIEIKYRDTQYNDIEMDTIKSFDIIDNVNVKDNNVYKMSFIMNDSHLVTKSNVEVKEYQLLSKPFKSNMNMVINRELPRLYGRLAIGYIKMLDETIIPKKSSLYDDKNNRIFTNSVNKCYYRNGVKIDCRVQPCKDGIHVIIEAEKAYGSALLMVKKTDINFDKFLLNVNFETAIKIYHTPGNITRVMELI